MGKDKVVHYGIAEEIIGEPTLKVDDRELDPIEIAIDVLYSYANIEKEKLSYFIKNFGLTRILNDPEIMGLTIEQVNAVNEIKYMLEAK